MSTTASTTATCEEYSTAEEQSLEYRALHTGAVVGLLFGVASACTVLTASSSIENCLIVCPIPLVGLFISLRAWAQITRQSDLFTGSSLAVAGAALSLFFLFSGVSYASYVYATEVPEGYERISFGHMKPDEVEERGDKLIPEDIIALHGKKVFIKGYIRPDSLLVRKNAKKFLLVRDNNQCCFGDVSKVKYYDQIEVAMQDSLSVDYSTGLYRMGGTLRVHPQNLLHGPGAAVFSLEADYVN